MENKTKDIIIILLSLIILGITIALLCVTGNISLGNNNKDNQNDNSNSQTVEKTGIPQTTLQMIVENELSILDNKKSISELTNDDKLSVAWNNIGNIGEKEKISKTDMETAWQKSALSNLEIKYTDFKTMGEGICYDSENETFTSCSESAYSAPYSVYSKVTGYLCSGDKCTINYQYLWTNQDKDPYQLYGKYSDAQAKKNAITSLTKTLENEELKNYAQENYDSLKKKLDTYHYVFQKTNNKIQLIDFYVD